MFENMTYTTRRNIVIFGGSLIHLCLGSFYAFGNISPYIMSYLRNRTQETWLVNTQNSWIMNAAAISAPIGSITGSYIERNHGVRIAVGIGCGLFCSGVLLTYFAIQRSLYIVALTYGFITNLGTFIAYGPPVQNAAKWMPARPALAVGLIVGGFGLGAFVFNLVITYYINPDNIQINDNDYFTDQALLDRVPRVFFLLAGIYVALQVIGVFLTSPVPPENDHMRVSRTREDQPSCAVDNRAASSDGGDFEEAQTVWKTVKEIFVNKDAWKIHFIILFVYAGMQVVHSYYKIYGQTFIKNDTYLGLVGSIASVFNSFCRPLWGIVFDKKGFKFTMTIILAIYVTLSCTIMYTEKITAHNQAFGEACFMIWICGMYAMFAGLWSVCPTVYSKLFGPNNMAVCLGYQFLALGIGILVGNSAGLWLKNIIGWHWMYILAGTMDAAAFVCTLWFNGKNIDTDDDI